jgi:hypothetical protein
MAAVPFCRLVGSRWHEHMAGPQRACLPLASREHWRRACIPSAATVVSHTWTGDLLACFGAFVAKTDSEWRKATVESVTSLMPT